MTAAGVNRHHCLKGLPRAALFFDLAQPTNSLTRGLPVSMDFSY